MRSLQLSPRLDREPGGLTTPDRSRPLHKPAEAGADPGKMSRVISAAEPRPASRAPLWWAAVALLFGAAFGTNVFTALLSLYRSHLHLSATDVNAIFGVYALGLAPSLLL